MSNRAWLAVKRWQLVLSQRNPGDRYEVGQAGPHFLRKPFTVESLARKIREVLDEPVADERVPTRCLERDSVEGYLATWPVILWVGGSRSGDSEAEATSAPSYGV